MYFCPFVIPSDTGKTLCVSVDRAGANDLEATHAAPKRQTNWTSEYLSDPTIDRYAVKADSGELIALAAYQIRDRSAYVHILYAESAPHRNPAMKLKENPYLGNLVGLSDICWPMRMRGGCFQNF